MADLIRGEDLNKLHEASELCEVADTAAETHELESIARLCNLAANTGEHWAIWDKPLSDTAKSKLQDLRYEIKSAPNAAVPDSIWYISWKVCDSE